MSRTSATARMRNAYPTSRQLECVRAVKDHTTETGKSPSAQDIADALGMSRQGASRLLATCQEKGLLGDIPIEVSSGKWAVTSAGERWIRR